MFSLSWLNSLVGGFFIVTTKRALPEFLSLADAYSKTPYCLWQPACAFALGVLSAWGVLAPVTHMICSLSSPRSLLRCHPLHSESFSENSFEIASTPKMVHTLHHTFLSQSTYHHPHIVYCNYFLFCPCRIQVPWRQGFLSVLLLLNLHSSAWYLLDNICSVFLKELQILISASSKN